MQQNSYKLPFGVNSINALFNTQNEDIKKRVDFLFNSFNAETVQSFETEPSSCIEYVEFFDIQSEILYIIDDIKSLVESGKASYSQIAVFIDKTEARKKFLDLIKAQKLPVISSIYNEDYENLKNKINLYQKISDVFLTGPTDLVASGDILDEDLAY